MFGVLKKSLPKRLPVGLTLLDFAVQIPDSNDGKRHGQALGCHLFKDVCNELFHKSAAVPALEACGFPCWVSLGILHRPRHPRHPGAEALLAGSVSLGLRIGRRSFEVAASFLVVLGATFCGQTSTFRDRELLALLDGEVDLFFWH